MSDYMQCPFNRLHQVPPKTFGKHLVKCQRQNPEIKLERCPLNSYHMMPKEKIKEHLRTCPSRGELELYQKTVSTTASGQASSESNSVLDLILNTPSEAVASGSLQEDEECWEDDNCKAYNPVEYCKKRQENDPTFIVPAPCKLIGLKNPQGDEVEGEESAPLKREPLSESDTESTATSTINEAKDVQPIMVKMEPHDARKAAGPARRQEHSSHRGTPYDRSTKNEQHARDSQKQTVGKYRSHEFD
ncbi:gametocyte-specific factor 1-like [Anopheles cruzii]|uniref:gametocyte-specific factor 1-like n=1 Tax=Anopheles cruzii TaxID=68878 RepID=UPI0022EC21A4|nr:gametocyte-specific factor 1-like [Anopheles cruzii]